MTDLFLDFVGHALSAERRFLSQQRLEFLRPGLLDSLSVQSAMQEAIAGAAQWNAGSCALQRMMDSALGDQMFLRHEFSATQRAFDAMSQVGLTSLSDSALRSHYGAFELLLRDAQATSEPLDALVLTSSFRRADEWGRRQWLEACLPDFETLLDLGQSSWSTPPFHEDTRELLHDLVGEQSASAFDALGHATSARVRRGLYRELGASRHVEKLPAVVLREAFVPPDANEPLTGPAVQFLATLVRHGPVTRHHRRCYLLLAGFEAMLRRELSARMSVRHGEEWIQSISSEYRSAWLRKFRKHQGRDPEANALTAVLLPYSDLNDVMELLIDHFSGDVAVVHELELRFLLIRMVRNHVAHHRAVVAQDVVALQTAMVEAGRVLVPDLLN